MKNSKLPPHLLRWLPSICWMLLIFVLSSDSHSNEVTKEVFGGANFYARKGAHMSEYAILFFFLQFALRPSDNSEKRSSGPQISASQSEPEQDGSWIPIRYVWALLATIFYACSDEWHQGFVPGRSSEITDVMIDSTGATIAFCIMSAASAIKVQQQKARMQVQQSPQDQ